MTVTLEIKEVVYGGDGLGRLGDGRVCFVPGAYKGETVKAELVEQKKHFVRARLAEVLEAVPERLAVPEAAVPGMVYAGVSYAGELRYKQDQLENFLWKVSPEVLPLEVFGAASPRHYRNKVVYHVAQKAGRWAIGYRAEPGHEVVDVPEDPLARPEINAELPAIRRGVTALLTQGARQARAHIRAAENVTVRWTAVDGVKWWLDEPPQNLELHETTCGMRFRVSADGFYQVNPEMGELLVRHVRDEYLAGADRAGHILDLYCGVGVFGLACLKTTPGAAAPAPAAVKPRLVGIESVREAIAAAKRNAEAHGIAANFFCERVGASLARIKVGAHHTVIVDPPRGGMEPNVPEWLANRPAPRILYVSCDPATLTRDLRQLVRHYAIRRVKLFDLFPRTARFETLVVLERRG